MLKEWAQKSQDLRYLNIHSLKRKDLIWTRTVGRWISNLYCPYDDCPFKLSPDGKKNPSNFQNVDGHKICFICRDIACRQWYWAGKMTECCRESGNLTIYHIDAHKCLVKPNMKKYRLQVREAVLRNSGLGMHAIQQAEVGDAVAVGNVKEA